MSAHYYVHIEIQSDLLQKRMRGLSDSAEGLTVLQEFVRGECHPFIEALVAQIQHDFKNQQGAWER